jgi:flagellar motor switch protein FliN/FliY
MSTFDPMKQPSEGGMPELPSGFDLGSAAEGGETPGPGGTGGLSLETIMRIPVSVKIVLGSASMPVAALLKLGRGALIPLDRKIGEPVDVVVNGRIVARGEVVVMDGDSSRFGISLTEVVGPSVADKLP